MQIFIWSSFFSILFISNKWCLSVLFPNWWMKLSSNEQTDVPPCFVNCIHHVVVVPFGLYYIFTYATVGIYMPSEVLTLMIPGTIGYLVADTIFFAIPQAITTKSLDYMIHHIVGIYLSYIVMFATESSILIFVSSMFITEISTILLNISIIIKSTSYKNSPKIVNYFEYLFAFTFIVTRIFNLTYQTYICIPSTHSVGIGKYCLIPLLILQYFWLYKIILIAMKTPTNIENKQL